MKLKLLVCSESSLLNSGYSILYKQLLRRLHNVDFLEVAEHASYIHSKDPRLETLPWKVYCNLPDPGDTKAFEAYNSNVFNQFGAFTFDKVVLDFKPDVVFDARDNWYMAHTMNSPLRPYYKLFWCPAVDSYPQNPEWIDNFGRCDGLFSYTDWGCQVLKNHGLNPLGSLPPIVDDVFHPILDKFNHKKKYGLEKVKIIGTVMRNQRRKLFPDLFQSFRHYLDYSNRQDILLYCHTSYPDKAPWEIPRLLQEFGLSGRVLFTYICSHCKFAFPTFYRDYVIICPKCGEAKCTTSNVQNGVDNTFLNEIYNLFDLYIQYANSEGFGIPIAESAACAVPAMAVDFSGMSDVIRKVGGTPIPIAGTYRELETGCYRAVPSNEDFVFLLDNFFKQSDEEQSRLGEQAYWHFRQNYSGNDIVQKLVDCLNQLVRIGNYNSWTKPPNIHVIPKFSDCEHMTNSECATWLICNVLGRPDLIGSHMHLRLVKDLNYKFTTGGMGGVYFNENSLAFGEPQNQPFNAELAYRHFSHLGEYKNHIEQLRTQ